MFLDLNLFNKFSKLFKDGANFKCLKPMLKTMSLVQVSNLEHRAILAYLLLFDPNDKTLTNEDKLEIRILGEILCPVSLPIKLKNVLSALSQMAVFSLYNIDWNPGFSIETLKCHNLVMNYTLEEENWIQKQFLHVNEEFKSIPLGEEILEDFTMYSLDVPLSKPFLKNCFSIVQERMKKIFFSQQEFCELPHSVQVQVLAKRSFVCTALFQAKCENCLTGQEQLNIAFGTSEAEYWMNKYQSVFERKEIRRIGILEACSQTLPLKPSDELCRKYKNLIEGLKLVVGHPDFYLFGLMLVATKPVAVANDESTEAVLSKLNATYKLLLYRRLKNSLENEKDGAKVLFQKILDAVDSVERLSHVLISLIPHLSENIK